nr:xylulose kinase-1 [Tanacetum cinerariifolium]
MSFEIIHIPPIMFKKSVVYDSHMEMVFSKNKGAMYVLQKMTRWDGEVERNNYGDRGLGFRAEHTNRSTGQENQTDQTERSSVLDQFGLQSGRLGPRHADAMLTSRWYFLSPSFSYFPSMSKNDMKNRVYTLSKDDLEDLVKTFRIPSDHPRIPIPFFTFLLSILKYFKFSFAKRWNTEDVCMDDCTSSMKKWKNKYFLIDRRVIPDYLTWRHSHSCVSDDLLVDGYDPNYVKRICARLSCLREMGEEVLVRFGLSSIWSNHKCDLVFRRKDDNSEMSIYDFMTVPSWGDAKVLLSLCLLQTRLSPPNLILNWPRNQKLWVSEGLPPLVAPSKQNHPPKRKRLKKKASEAGSSAPAMKQPESVDDVDISELYVDLECSMERDEGTFVSAASALVLCLGKRLGPSLPYRLLLFSSHLRLGPLLLLLLLVVVLFEKVSLDTLARSSLSHDVEYDQIPEDDFAIVMKWTRSVVVLSKDEYETWAIKIEYWIMNTDHNLGKIIQNGNSKKSLGRDSKGGIIILSPVSFEEYVAIQREIKARTLLLQSLPEDHMADFHHLDDAREIWLAVNARFGDNEESKKMRKTMLKQEFLEFSVSEEEGLHKGYDRFQKILSQLNQMQAKPDNDDVNI